MPKRIGVALIAIALLLPLSATAQKGGRSSTRHSSSSTRSQLIIEAEKHFDTLAEVVSSGLPEEAEGYDPRK